MLLPAAVDFHNRNPDAYVFLYSCIASLTISILLWLATRGVRWVFTIKTGFLLVTALWVVSIFVGSLPLYFSHIGLKFSESIFETASGLTTTGSTILTNLDQLPAGILLWRSLLCWIGGIGFVSLALLLLPSLRIGGMQLFYLESSEKSEKIFPRIRQISTAVIIAYMGLTIICVLCYYAAGMSFFDAFNHALTTISTAGFSTHDASIGFFNSQRIMVICTIFMFLSSLPFIFYIQIVSFVKISLLKDPQVVLFTQIVLYGSFILAVWIHFYMHIPFDKAFIKTSFHFVSVMTTTGYAVEDYSLWGPFCFGVFILASFLGGCAGSTAGGFKISRILLLFRLVKMSLLKIITPHSVEKLYYGDHEVGSDFQKSLLFFVLFYFVSLIFGSAFLVMTGTDFVSAFSGAFTALSNVGPGFGDQIGPVGNFSAMNSQGLWILTFLMLSGRLEFIAIYMLFIPALWTRD